MNKDILHTHTHTHIYIYTCIHYTHTNIHTYIPTYLPTYLRTYVPTYLRTYAPTHLCTYAHTHVRTYARTYVHTYLHTYIPTYLHTHIPTYRHTYIPTHTHTIVYAWGISTHSTRSNSKIWIMTPKKWMVSCQQEPRARPSEEQVRAQPALASWFIGGMGRPWSNLGWSWWLCRIQGMLVCGSDHPLRSSLSSLVIHGGDAQ